MFIDTNETLADGSLLPRRLWGVTYRKEKRVIKPKFANMDEPGVAEEYERAAEMNAEYVCNGHPSPIENITHSFYLATMRVQGKVRYLGKTVTAKKAACLYDAALFHLWGFLKNPKARFNYYNPEADEDPAMDTRLKQLRSELYFELRKKKIDPKIFDFNYCQSQQEQV